MSRADYHSIGKFDIYEPEDKSFSKHLLKAGHSDEKPRTGAICTVYIVCVGEFFYCLLH